MANGNVRHGEINLLEIHTTLSHVVQEMNRIGEVVSETQRDNSSEHDAIKGQLADLDKRLAIADKDIKNQIARISGITAMIVSFILWALKSGLLAAMGGP